MSRRTPNPHALRPYAVEYYRQLTHKHPDKVGCVISPKNALLGADRNLDGGREYVRAVAYNRRTGLVLWTRIKVGRHLIMLEGDKMADRLPAVKVVE